MKREMISLSTVILIILSGCIFQSNALSVEIVSITPDKEVYHSHESMKLDISLDSSHGLQNVTVNANGLKNKYGKILFNETVVVDLVQGVSNVTFSYTMPTCSSCKGLKRGEYIVNIIIIYQEEILVNGTTNVTLR